MRSLRPRERGSSGCASLVTGRDSGTSQRGSTNVVYPSTGRFSNVSRRPVGQRIESRIDSRGRAEAEKNAQVALREVAPSALYFADLIRRADRESQPSAERVSGARPADEPEPGPVVLRAAVVAHQRNGLVHVGDGHVHVAVVVVVGEGRGPRGVLRRDGGTGARTKRPRSASLPGSRRGAPAAHTHFESAPTPPPDRRGR